MAATVKTGSTKAATDTVLLSKELQGADGEQAFLLLQLIGDVSGAKTLQKECMQIIEQSLLETEGEASQRLDSTLKELNGLFRGLLLSKALTDLHAIVGILEPGGQLSVSHAGRAEAYVIRGGIASQITEYTKGKPVPTFVHIATGQLEADDVVVLSTQRLLRTVTPAQLAQMATRSPDLIGELKKSLETEEEEAALASLHVDRIAAAASTSSAAAAARPKRKRGGNPITSATSVLSDMAKKGKRATAGMSGADLGNKLKGTIGNFSRDLQDPRRKKRAHLLAMAGILVIFLGIWAAAHLTSFSKKSQTKAELEAVIQQINEEIRKGENRRLTGDVDSANAILERAKQMANQVMRDESGLFRTEALDIIDRIDAKREEINNIIRLSPNVVVNLSSKKPGVQAQGFVGLEDGEFLAYDRQDIYRIVFNSMDDPTRLSEEELITDATNFPRYQSQTFQVTNNGIIELINGQPVGMKTEDEAGWIAGKDIEAYLRYLYVLVPANNQIYKYERLSNRYSPPVEYNVNGDLAGALDIAIDGNIYVLKEGGEVVKLLRGETQPFVIRNAPENVLQDATRVFKVFEGKLYFLDPVSSSVIIVTDGGPGGESTYLRQYVLEGDTVGELTDLYVNPDESELYVLDEKRMYKINLGPGG